VARRKTAARGKISIEEAFHKLMPALGPHGAVDEMNKAMLRDDKGARLFCNDRVVDPNFIRDHLIVKGPGSRRADGRRRRRTEIVATRALEEPVEAYTWEVDSKQIEALLPQPELERPWPTVSGSVNWSPPAILAPATPLSTTATHRPPSTRHEACRAFAIKGFGEDWVNVATPVIIKAAEKDEDFCKKVKPFPSPSTWARSLGRKKS
jgi:hypothetical protein